MTRAEPSASEGEARELTTGGFWRCRQAGKEVEMARCG
jgi:hypothetical protein